jgi:thiamine-phosphate pyrophosphorylase
LTTNSARFRQAVSNQVYGITPDGVPASWIASAAAAAFEAGLRVLQLRSKHLTTAVKAGLADQLLRSAQPYGALLIINDDMHLAAQTGADGVHLGSQDGAIASARALLGPTAIVGASCYASLALAHAAQGADYIAFGALFPSITKPHAVRADLSLFKAAAPLAMPTVGIGGVGLSNAASVIANGASCVALISALFPPLSDHTQASYSAQVQRNTAAVLSLLEGTGNL